MTIKYFESQLYLFAQTSQKRVLTSPSQKEVKLLLTMKNVLMLSIHFNDAANRLKIPINEDLLEIIIDVDDSIHNNH